MTQPKIASCPARSRCRRYLRHEPDEYWNFCTVKENVRRHKHPIPAHLIGTHYTGFPPDDLCEHDGRSLLSKCIVYKDAIEIGFIQNGIVRVPEELKKQFAELEKSEKHLEAFRKVMNL